MKIRMMLAVLLVVAFLAGMGEAAVVQEIHFAPGSTSVLLKGAVIRGESDQYYLTARAGQKMEVSVAAVEKNAALAIYQPGFKVGKDADGLMEVKGTALKGAAEGDDASAWQGTLPKSGQYLILVGPTRGNATYKLKVSVH